MSSNNDPHDQGNTPRNRGRHGEQDDRTFPADGSRSSAEVPRTFPSGANGPARVSPPVAPSESSAYSPRNQTPAQGSSDSGGTSDANRPGPGQSNTGQSAQPGAGQPGSGQPGSGQPRYPAPTYPNNGVPGASSETDQTRINRPQNNQAPSNQAPNQTRVQPTYAQSPVDNSTGQTGPGHHTNGGAPAGQAYGAPGEANGGSGYGNGQGHSGGPGYGNGSGYGNAAGYGSGSGYGSGPGNSNGAGNTQQPNAYAGSSATNDTNPYGTPYAQGAAGQPGSGTSAFGAVGNQPQPGGYPGAGDPGAQPGPGGQGPYGGGEPPRREKRGPGWGATIAIALIAALLGGGAAFGGSYAVSALQGGEPRKVAEQTIETPDWTEVAKKTSESVVSIQVGTSGQVQALGSGSLYDDQGHVITNNHVVAPADTPDGEITVTMKNGGTTKADIVGRDPSTDIAIIKLEQVPDDVDPLPVGDSKKMSVGDPVMALGNPLGLADSVTTGIVSALDRPVSTENIGEDASSQEKEMTITNAIQTDAAINPGNSGGPLVDGNGNFIGVNSAAASLSQSGEGQQSGSIGIGFAIPASQAVMIADQLISSGKAQHPFLGITLTDGQINSGGITRGSAKVQSVQSGSPAEAAGFKDGDDVVAVGDTKVNSAISLRALVRAQPVNSPVDFTIVRGGQEQKLSVTLVLQ